MPAEPLTHIGKYRILELVGEGAMGVVYRAEDTVLQRTVAIKVMSEAIARQDDLRSRFLREAQAAGSLQHPNVVTIYDFGEVNDHLYIAMEFVVGEDLAALLARGAPLTLARKLEIAIDALTGLSYAHRRGIVHRDVKPANIRVGEDGRAKIMDFGVARLEQSTVTQTGVLVGTPSYMAPEQVTGGPLTAAVDVFAFGAVLHELLTGAKPFDGPTLHALLYKILSDAPPPPSQLVPGLPPALDAIVARALAKEPAARYATALEMADELSAVRASLTGTPHVATLSLRASIAGGVATPVQGAAAPAAPATAARRGGRRAAALAGGALGLIAVAAGVGAALARRGGDVPVAPSGAAQEANGVAPAAGTPAAPADARPNGAPSAAPSAAPAAAEGARRGGGVTASAPNERPAPAPAGGAARPSPTAPTAPAPQRTLATSSAPVTSGAQPPGTPPAGTVTSSAVTTPPAESAVSGPPPVVTPAAASAPAPAPARPVVSAPVADPREIPAVVEAYARAIESRDVAAVRRAYPGLSAAQQRNFEQFFDYARVVRVTFNVAGVETNGPTAEVRVTGSYDFATAAGKRERQPVSFNATVRHDGGGWRLVAVR